MASLETDDVRHTSKAGEVAVEETVKSVVYLERALLASVFVKEEVGDEVKFGIWPFVCKFLGVRSELKHRHQREGKLTLKRLKRATWVFKDTSVFPTSETTV